jgi:hypothetical protein
MHLGFVLRVFFRVLGVDDGGVLGFDDRLAEVENET